MAIFHEPCVLADSTKAGAGSGDSWSTFGLKKPNYWLDALSGCFVYFASFAVTAVGVDLLISILTSFEMENYQSTPPAFHFFFAQPQGWCGVAGLLVLSTAIGFSEELVMRGYLIPRLEKLLH